MPVMTRSRAGETATSKTLASSLSETDKTESTSRSETDKSSWSTSSSRSNGKVQKRHVASSATKAVTVAPDGYQVPSKVLAYAPPPYHTVAILVCFSSVFLHFLPSLESIDEIATVETFTKRIFPDYMSIQTLGWVRLVIAAIIFGTSFQTAVLSNGWMQITVYKAGSQLVRAQNHMVGIKTMFPFTSVSWNLLGSAFALSSYIALKVSMNTSSPEEMGDVDFHPWTLRCALICWELAAPFSFLVASVIRYAIWPGVLRSKNPTENLKNWRNKLMHNINVVFAMTETSMLGGMPVMWQHVSFAPLVGSAYIIFSWLIQNKWTKDHAKNGPQFIYYFFDTTLPKMASIALLALLFVLMVFYAAFVVMEEILVLVDGSMLMHAVLALGISSTVMRFRD